MLASQVPVKFQIPFANSAGASFINAIPLSSQIGVTGGAASLTDGFPPITFQPVGAGGIAPWGRDMNGLFNQITAWNRWQGAGGVCSFDASFAAAIGGYPSGAFLASASPGNAWVSVVDNNLTDPNANPGSPNWAAVAFITPVQNNSYISADDTGAADNYITAPAPAITAYSKYQRFQVKINNTNLTTTPTLNVQGVSGLLGAKTIVRPNGSAMHPGDLVPGMIAAFIYDGTRMQLENAVSSLVGTGLINVQFFTASSTYVPTSGATKAFGFVTGAGGAGASALSCGGGGGAGATAVFFVPISFGSVPVTIGAGGVGTGGNGGNGTGSSLGTIATAGGGSGGVSNGGGLGSATGTGLFVIPGGDGVTVESLAPGFGSGTGGASFWGGGGLGAPFIIGSIGRAYGAGGGGSDSGANGAIGSPGFVLILEF